MWVRCDKTASSLYALLRKSYGLCGQALREVTQAVLVAQLLYASPPWSGFLKADEISKLQMVLNKAVHYGFFPLGCRTTDELFECSGNTLFSEILNNPDHCSSWQWDWTGPVMLIVLFLVSHFNFLFVPCGGLSWLPVSFLLHVKYTVSYRIVFTSFTSSKTIYVSVAAAGINSDTVTQVLWKRTLFISTKTFIVGWKRIIYAFSLQ